MLNEADIIETLTREIAEACVPHGPFETIFVNDGSTDHTSAEIARMRAEFPWLREIRHRNACGQSAAVRSGVLYARAPVVCTIDGDGQNPPMEIPKLVSRLLDVPAKPDLPLGLVAGERVGRRDPAIRKLASRIANALRARILGDAARDTGCGLKAFPKEVFLSLPFFDHIHRYLPALVHREGYEVEYVDVSHRARATGRSKYTNLSRAMIGVQDLLGVRWLLLRRKLPEIVHEDL